MAGFRVYVEQENAFAVGECVSLSRKEAHHLVRVLRAREGDTVTLFDGQGSYAVGKLNASGKDAVVAVEVVGREPEPRWRLELVPALLKGKSMDALLRQAVECGVTHITPVQTRHCEARFAPSDREAKRQGWVDSLIEAAKQCGQLRLPCLADIVDFEDWLAEFSHLSGESTLTVYASLEAGSELLLPALERILSPMSAGECVRVRILIGPEGDFSDHEYASLRDSGAVPVRLGNSVLRAGTAAIYALAVADQCLQEAYSAEHLKAGSHVPGVE